MIKRFFDIIMSLILFILLFPLICFIGLIVFIDDGRPIVFWSTRMGRYHKKFQMPKFRTMKKNVPQLATHLLNLSQDYLTKSGKILRLFSLDEIPQLWSIFKGDMSFVGPRPALFNQENLIESRSSAGIDKLIPGVTGWAQINGRDKISIEQKVKLDIEYRDRKNFWFDLKILIKTFFKAFSSRDISH